MKVFLKLFTFLPAAAVMYMIFVFSAQPGDQSTAMSSKVSYQIVKTADKVIGTNLDDYQIRDIAVRYDGITRKACHAAEFFLLTITLLIPLYVFGMRGFPLYLTAFLISLGYAAGDEYHQTFVPGRSGTPFDVLYDSAGVVSALLFYRIITAVGHFLFPRRRTSAEYSAARQMERLQEQQQMNNQELRRIRKQQAKEARERELARREAEARQPLREDRFSDDYSYARYDHDPQAQYVPPEEEEDYEPPVESSDKLSEDMPFAGVLQPKRRAYAANVHGQARVRRSS